jgi:hypothetical protein
MQYITLFYVITTENVIFFYWYLILQLQVQFGYKISGHTDVPTHRLVIPGPAL